MTSRHARTPADAVWEAEAEQILNKEHHHQQHHVERPDSSTATPAEE